MKNFKEVQIGNVAEDYNCDISKVVAKGKGYDEFLKFGKKYDNSGGMQEGFEDGYTDKDQEWIAVYSEEFEEFIVYSYDYDGAVVKN